MAVTGLRLVKSRPARTIGYVTRTREVRNPDDQSLCLMECFGCRRMESAADDFVRARNFWGDESEYRCVNGFQSFQKGEVSLEEAHSIGQELIRALWSDRYQVVLATHSDTEHYHNHFIINTVSLQTGEPFPFGPDALRAMRQTSDEICDRHHLSVIRNPSWFHRRSYAEMKAEKEGRLTLRGTIRNDIDRAVAASYTLRDIWNNLSTMGYELNLLRDDGTPRKTPMLCPPGGRLFFSFHRLGEAYTPDALKKRAWGRLTTQPLISRADEAEIARLKAENPPPLWQEDSICQTFQRYQYELKILAGHPGYVTRVSFYVRRDLVWPDRLDEEIRLLDGQQIQTREDLQNCRWDRTAQIDPLITERTRLYREKKRNPKASDRIAEINLQLRVLRKEVRICDRIEKRMEDVSTELTELLKQRDERTRKEVKRHELHR